MANCSSSHLHARSFAARDSAQYDNLQDLLPPRKRLLLGLKHAATIPSNTSLISPPPPESLRIKANVDAAHTFPIPPDGLRLCSPSQKCFTCGDGRVSLHRVPYLAGSSGYHCSSCILEMNKKMYCVLCYEVIDEDSGSARSTDLLTCCRCERITHFHCALRLWSPSLDGVGLSLCNDCHARSKGQSIDADITIQESGGGQQFKELVLPNGKVKLPLVCVEEVVAAKIVALTAKRAALKAKQKARLLAKTAACAAIEAKTCLDYMYKLSQKEADNVAVDGEPREEVDIAGHRTSKSLKTRALSSIVASEMFSKRDGATDNSVITPDYVPNEHGGTSSDSEFAEAGSPCDIEGDEPVPCMTHKGRLALKRKKSLSLLGLQNSTTKLAALKSSKMAGRKALKSGFLSKGNLGSIMSQVLASNKLSRSSTKAPCWKAKVGGSHCTPLDISSGSGMKKKMPSMAAMDLENGCSADDICSS